MSAQRAIVLVEPSPGAMGAHGAENLVRLCGHGLAVRTVVITSGPIHHDAAPSVHRSADVVVDDPRSAGAIGSVLMVLARALERCRATLKRRFPTRWWADQPGLMARFLVEVACLRAARPFARAPGDAIVLLTANEVLHATSRAVSGVDHLRFVHEFTTRHGPWFGMVDRLSSRLVEPPLVLCPTEGVQRLVRRETPAVPTAVQTFAVWGAPMDSAAARRSMRAELGFADSSLLVGVFGGWWPYKDHEVVVAAIESLDRPIGVVVVGDVVDGDLVARLRDRLGPGLVHLGGAVPSERYAALCAAVDAIVISRRPGVDKESGLLLDAVRVGTPVVMSDSDRALVDRLGGRPWVHVFEAGDAPSLQQRLETIPAPPEHRPGPADAADLGMMSADEAITTFLRRVGDRAAEA